MSPVVVGMVGVGVLLALAMIGAPLWAWAIAVAVLLALAQAPAWTFVVVAIPFVALLARPLRMALLTRPILAMARRLGLVPTISETERVALAAGTTFVDAEFFTGSPSWKRIAAEPWPELSAREQAFLDGPVAQACAMADDWAIREAQDLPPELWAFLKRERFFSMIIPENRGGLAFSPRAQAAVVTRLGSHSIPLAVTVMVPNSLGPAELLVHYGTPEQQERWLPRLARGEEIPCFALTEPEAGSDAGGMQASGVVERSDDGAPRLRLSWDKRYITLAPVATLIGLAFKLKDPENLLGHGVEPGITCALIPASTKGVEIGRRHDPMGSAFLNGPTTGKDVVVPVDAIIGGAAGAGNGWRMLMECLASGRAISLPSLSVGTAKRVARVATAHAVVRRQFGMPIGRFEGIEEPLARIAGHAWLMEATQVTTCGALASGGKPSVASAIAKHAQTEAARAVIADGMDILGGAGVVRGPRNLLEGYWTAQPISITVEGANILTRSLIIFGQGVIRSHPHAQAEADAIAANDAPGLDAALWPHVGLVIRNLARVIVLSPTRGWFVLDGPDGPARSAWRRVRWASASFALFADVALGALGGDLKRREKLTGHLADVLSALYLATCAIKRFESEGRRSEDEPFLRWATEECFARAQAGFDAALRNFPVPLVGAILAGPIALWSRMNPWSRGPSDALGHALARASQEPGTLRDRLLAGDFVPREDGDALRGLEAAFALAHRSQAVTDRLKQAMRAGKIERGDVEDALDAALAAGVITGEEAALVRAAREARRAAIQVDSFPPP